MNVAAMPLQTPASDNEHAVRVRTLFLSDIHLGSRGCRAGRLLDFLRGHEADTVYLVGDIVDGWHLKSGWYWPQDHNDVVQKLLRQARKGTRVIYVPGNHDEFMRWFYGTHFGGVEVVREAIHVGADGRRYLITHGDRFDAVVRHARRLARVGKRAYDLAAVVNASCNAVRRLFGFPY
jgi:UDP-2,3-diacylglucosamine pyrophosphatase LpxH